MIEKFSQMPMIGRQDILDAIFQKIEQHWGRREVICLYGAVGIGKTRMLQEICKIYQGCYIFDFDDRNFHRTERFEYEIAKGLDATAFEPFLRAQADYFIMKKSGVGQDGLKRQQEATEKAFGECFNRFSKDKRPVLLFDTFDERILPEDHDIWKDFEKKLPQFQNAVIIIAGREADKLGKLLQPTLKEDVDFIELRPLSLEDSSEYLQKKARQMYITVEEEFAEKLLFLSNGKPILLDLVVEMRGRGISLDWLATESLDALYLLNNDPQKAKRLEEFEHALVNHIADLRQTFDELVLLLSYINPLNAQMIAALLDISQEEANALFERAGQFMFIKFLPNRFIKLHDEMERMVIEHVWPKIDPENFRRRMYSQQACVYLTKEIKQASSILAEKRNEFNKLERDDKRVWRELELENDLNEIQELYEAIWLMKEQQLRHALVANLDNGIKLFADLFDETSDPKLRQKLFTQIQDYKNKFQPQHKIISSLHQIKLWSSEKEHHNETIYLCKELLEKATLSKEQIIDLLILQGNLNIRLGDVYKGLQNFESAVEQSEDGYKKGALPPFWLIKSEKELGWAYRLTGSLKNAEKHYRKARSLCLQHGGPANKTLQYDYGMILNNLAFVLSNNRNTREAAESIAKTAIEHWKSIGHQIGLGAGYIVLGVALYRKGDFVSALDEFQKAEDIFTPFAQTDWLGQVYAWRGAVYRAMKEFEKAEDDLKKALRIGTENLKAMILSRLGRIYMSRKEWNKARETLEMSLQFARKIPDYIYGLTSLSRLIMIAAEVGEYYRLDEFDSMLHEYLSNIEEPDQNNEGIAYIALAKLALGQNDKKNLPRIIEYLKEGIRLVTEYGSYASRDIVSRLKAIERAFEGIDPNIINHIGKSLLEYTAEKEIADINYNSVTDIMYSWAHWKEGEATNEK